MRTRLAFVAIVALGLPSCGGDDSDGTVDGKRGRAVTPAEMADAMRKAGLHDQATTQAEIERMSAELGATLGGDVHDVARKAKALAERRLTSADLDTYLALMPKVRNAGATAEVLADHGLTVTEWQVLRARVMSLTAMASLPEAARKPELAADLETIRPYLDRLKASARGR